MAAIAADRDLLFGLLALQNGLIDQGALVAAFQAWTRDKARSLADQLVARGDLDRDDRSAVEALVARHIKKHGDVEHSLAAVAANRSTRDSLADLHEPEIEASLAWVTRCKNGHAIEVDDDGDPDRTAGLSVGAATSDGERFRLLRHHARGGLGDVFVALDTELHREVALKQILEKHADDPVSRQRFVAEAEITGGLEHPGVVPVYGLGTYGGGRPYYAMRFIKGDSLKEAIGHFQGDEGDAGWVEQSEAHRNSQSHRDTARHWWASKARPALRDSGRRSLKLRKLLRRFLDVCNAIDYAHSRGVIHRDIKPANIILGKHGETPLVDWGLAKAIGRADPSLGEQTIAPSSSGSSETLPGSALGTPAYMSPEQAGGDLDRLGPRSDVYSLGATLYCLLTGRPPFEGEDIGEILRRVQAGDFRAPRGVDPSLDKALEAVCMKAMAKTPADRYASGRALAEDVERWMADEPVTAYPEPWTRSLVRWLTRHRTGVTGVAAAVLAGVVGLSAVLAVQTRANAQLSVALKRETKASLDLAAANGELIRSKQAVQARYELALEAIKTVHTGVSEELLLKQDQFKELRDRLLKSASNFYGKLGALLGMETDVASRRALAQSNFELADLTGKIGDKEAALAAHRAVLAAREALTVGPGAEAGLEVDVGKSFAVVAGLLRETGKTEEALAAYRRSESRLAGLATSDPAARAALADCRSGLGWLQYKVGRHTEALAAYRLARVDQEALAATPGASNDVRRDLASTVNRIALVLSDTGKQAEAEAEYRKALAIQQKLADDNPAVTEFRTPLARDHINLGTLLKFTGKTAEAEAEYREAIAISQKLADDNPAVTDFRSLLAFSNERLGNLLDETGRPTEAEAKYRTAVARLQKLADDNPAVTELRDRLAMNHGNLGWLLTGTGKPAEAEGEYRRALEILGKLSTDNPKVAAYRDAEANNCNNLSVVFRRSGRPAEARALCDRAVGLREALVGENPRGTHYRTGLAENLHNRGLALLAAGDRSAAAADLRRATELYAAEPSLTGEHQYFFGCARAALSGLAGSGVSAAEADAAMSVLRKAVVMGYRSLDRFRTDDALDPLRSRDEFRLLLMDVAFPAEPFAATR
jgi:serine/threonine-protein kinase